MDDTFGILIQNETNTAHIEFAACLCKVNSRLPFTFKIEENSRLLFLDVLLIREADGSLSSTIYRKESNTGLTIDPRSSQNPTAWIGVFKGALCRAHRLCSSTTLRDKEIKYLINNFEDNGFDRRKLASIAKEYKPPESMVAPPHTHNNQPHFANEQ